MELYKFTGPPQIIAQDITYNCNKVSYNTPFTFKVRRRDSTKEIITNIKFENLPKYELDNDEFKLYEYLARHPKTLRLGDPGEYVLVGKVNTLEFNPSAKIGDTVIFGDKIYRSAFANVDISKLEVRYVDEPYTGNTKPDGSYYSIVHDL